MTNLSSPSVKLAFETNTPVSQIIFIHDYFQIIMQENYLTFMSETFIATSDNEYPIPSKEGNWFFYKLIDQKVTDIQKSEKNIVITFDNGWKIIADICMEPPGENFNMGGEGLVPIYF